MTGLIGKWRMQTAVRAGPDLRPCGLRKPNATPAADALGRPPLPAWPSRAALPL
jgi:hypothetical protein